MTSLTIHRSGNPDAPTVVLVHGLTDSGTTWPDLLTHWGDRWDVLSPDLRGHGLSPRFTPDELRTAPDVLTADVVALLDEQPGPVVLVGHSLGGYLSVRATLARPEKVRALVVEDPARPGSNTPDPGFAAWHERFLDAVAQDRAGEEERMLRETPWSRTEVTAWAESKLHVDREYVRRALFLGEHDWEGMFGRLTVPTLLVVPPDAPMAPRAHGFANDLVRRVVIPGAGHCVRRDQPDLYHAAVDTFLAETLSRR